MAEAHQKILAACSSGDIPTLKILFEELKIGPGHPQSFYSLDRNIPEEQQLPVVVRMFEAAITGEQVEVISFLSVKFPNSSLYGFPMRAAIDTGNVQVLDAVCKCDPASANAELGDDECINALGYAASKKNGDKLVKVLLDAGADPNRDPPFKLPGCWNVSAAVLGGLPASTFEQFFDAGYRGKDPNALRYAVEMKRSDVFKVLFERGKDLAGAQFPPKEELIDAASKAGDLDMIATIKRAYALRSKQKKGLVANFLSKIRSQA